VEAERVGQVSIQVAPYVAEKLVICWTPEGVEGDGGGTGMHRKRKMSGYKKPSKRGGRYRFTFT